MIEQSELTLRLVATGTDFLGTASFYWIDLFAPGKGDANPFFRMTGFAYEPNKTNYGEVAIARWEAVTGGRARRAD